MPDNNLFSEFPPISKADWLQQIAKDLKDKPLSDYEWQIGESLKLSPFVHAEDFNVLPTPLWSEAKNWEICEIIQVHDPVTANISALEALNGGAEGLQFDFDNTPSWADMEQLLSGIQLDFIGVHFSGKAIRENPSSIFSHLLRLATARNLDTRQLRGSIEFKPLQAGGPIMDWRYLADLLEFTQESFPLYKIISVDLPAKDNPVIALAEALRVGNEYIRKLNDRELSLQSISAAIQFSMPVGKSYFLEIAKMRALKLLWINILKSWNAPIYYPTVSAYFRPEAYTDDLYSNMIRATTMAMSAVTGGADRLVVLPYDEGRENLAAYPAAFGRRIARNVQHLMKMESHLDDVYDPAAGSYYIEKLTTTLAENAWDLFSKAE